MFIRFQDIALSHSFPKTLYNQYERQLSRTDAKILETFTENINKTSTVAISTRITSLYCAASALCRRYAAVHTKLQSKTVIMERYYEKIKYVDVGERKAETRIKPVGTEISKKKKMGT